jgi:hypothetical protein
MAKLWVASRILGSHAAGGPFGKPLLDHTPDEIDFILEMGARDEPERFTFMRGGKDARVEAAKAKAAWLDTTIDNSQKLKMAGLAEQQAKLNQYKQRGRAASGMRPGMTRGGKAVSDVGD